MKNTRVQGEQKKGGGSGEMEFKGFLKMGRILKRASFEMFTLRWFEIFTSFNKARREVKPSERAFAKSDSVHVG